MQFFDAIALAAVVAELGKLGVCRIDKVGQSASHTLYLKARAGREALVLVLDFQDRWARMHLSARPVANMKVPTAFTMLCRKHLEGSRLLRVEQPGLDRVARLVIAGRDELGDPYERHLMVEFIGSYANACLVEGQTGVIMGCLRPVSDLMCQVRQLLPGLPYQGPPTLGSKTPFTDIQVADVAAVLQCEGRLLDCLCDRIGGIGKLALTQILTAAHLEPTSDVSECDRPEALWQALETARDQVLAGNFAPRLTPGEPWAYSMWPAAGVSVSSSASAVLAAYYEPLMETAQMQALRMGLQQRVAQRMRKARARLGQYEAKRAEVLGAEVHRISGELIYANLSAWRPGLTAMTVINHYEVDAPPLTLVLDPRLSASDNAQRYFRRYQKLRQAGHVLAGLLTDATDECAYLEQLQLTVEQATAVAELREIEEEVLGVSPIVTGRGAGRKPVESVPLRVFSSEGIPIWVGRNNRQNDHLTFRLARAQDWWLHAQNLPGAHVIVDTQGQDLSEATLHEAALLAAWFSKGREATGVSVVYTQRRHVRKMRQGRPGMVHYVEERCIFVKPDAEAVAAILARASAVSGGDASPPA
jgi:predicted ribosome quality control (RQC) complex YloA/Tae2 family protein